MRFLNHQRARQPVVSGLLLTCLVASTSTFASAQCVPYPIAIPIGNVTLSNGNTARGAELAVGHPPQSLAFLPQWPLNNTLVYGTNGYCSAPKDPAPKSTTGCTTWRGGQYSPLSSDTRLQPLDNPNPIDGDPYPSFQTYTDVFKLNDNVSIDDFAINVPLSDWKEEGYRPMMGLGLGSNSTVLSALKTGKHIASRVWSMFYGLTGADDYAQLDGILVLGGYDKAKVSGQPYTLDLQIKPGCPTGMLLTIDDMILHFPNGTSASIVTPSGSGFSSCITPEYPGLMTLHYDPYFVEFERITDTFISDRTFGLEYYTMLYSDGSEPFRGELSINIQQGPSVRIPSSELVRPERYIDTDTGAIIANYSRSNLVLNSLQAGNENDLSQLGRIFLSSAYVMLNQDNGEFTIWAANPTKSESLVGVDSKGNYITTFCVDSTNSMTPTPTPLVTKSGSTKLSSGAIAGIVVGAVAALAIITGALFWRRRRNKANAIGQATPQIASQGVAESPYPYPYSYYTPSSQDPSKMEPSIFPGSEPIPTLTELTADISESARSSAMGAPRFELGN
ncbi:aspartic peptidase domain-containing protein [Xylaria digitata]|nr:aspartic peptidase domain-containing protein [Xylaria digitata]